MARLWLIGTHCAATERRHYHQPAIGKLIIANYSVAVVRVFAGAAKAFEDCVGSNWAVENFASHLELLTFPGVNRHSRVDDLKDVIWADGEAVV